MSRRSVRREKDPPDLFLFPSHPISCIIGYLLAKHNDPPGCCLWRNAAGGVCIEDQKGVAFGTAAAALPVGCGYIGGRPDLQAQGIVRGNQVAIKMSDKSLLALPQDGN